MNLDKGYHKNQLWDYFIRLPCPLCGPCLLQVSLTEFLPTLLPASTNSTSFYQRIQARREGCSDASCSAGIPLPGRHRPDIVTKCLKMTKGQQRCCTQPEPVPFVKKF